MQSSQAESGPTLLVPHIDVGPGLQEDLQCICSLPSPFPPVQHCPALAISDVDMLHHVHLLLLQVIEEEL